MTAFPVPAAVPTAVTTRRARPGLALVRLLSRSWDVRLLRWAGEVAARSEARHLQAEIRRLEELSPHLLSDVGVRQIARGSYVIEEEGFDHAIGHGAHPIAERGPGLAHVFRQGA